MCLFFKGNNLNLGIVYVCYIVMILLADLIFFIFFYFFRFSSRNCEIYIILLIKIILTVI